MAWTKVQSTHIDGASTGSSPNWTCAFPSNVTAGNLLLALLGSDNPTMTAADNTGHNSWALVKAQADSGVDQKEALWRAIATQSEAMTVQFTTVGAFRSIIIQEWAHTGGGTITNDLNNGNSITATAITTPSITPTAADALVVALAWNNFSTMVTAGEVDSPFTLQDVCGFSAAAEDVGFAAYQQATPASVSATWHFNVSGQAGSIIASFIVSGATALDPLPASVGAHAGHFGPF